MKMRTAGPVQRIGLAVLAFTLGLFASGTAMATDVERQIPLLRDTAGSGLAVEISREGTRQTATPLLTMKNPTVRRIEERIVRSVEKTARLAEKEIPPGEITVGSMQGFLKALRASRKEKPAPAVVVTPPELRLGRTDTSRH